MRFVACLFGIVFTLISLVEFFGGAFWLYRVLNVFALLSWWITCRTQRVQLPEEEELIEMTEFPPLPSV